MSERAKPTAIIILLAAIGALIFGALGLQLFGYGQDGFGAAARFTARWSFFWFMCAWSASAFATLWPGGWRGLLLYNRRGFGLAFAAAHLIHAIFFIVAIVVMGHQSSLVTIVGGGLGYVFVILMALTSNDEAVRKLTPKRWKLLHTIGASYIAFIFAFTYLGSALHGRLIGSFALSLMAAAVFLKLAAQAKRRRLQAAA